MRKYTAIGTEDFFHDEELISPIGTPGYVSEKHILEEKKNPLAKIVTSNFTKEHPKGVTFERLIQYHDRTPQIRSAVSFYKELITGTDMTIEATNEEAGNYLDEWVRQSDFYTKFENLVSTLLICGNAILEKLDEKDIQDVSEVDMATIIAKKRDEFGNLQYYEHRTQNGQHDKLGEGKLGKFIEFNLTNISKQAWGRSLFYPLAVTRTVGNRTTAPLVEIMWAVEDAMGAIVINNAYPITTITYPAANDEYLEKEAIRWQRYKPGDKRVQKIKPEIEFFETQGNSKYTDYIAHLEKAFEIGTQFPHDIMTGDFTSRASSDTTENMVMKLARGFTRYLSNVLKTQLFDPLLIQGGYDPEKEDIKIGFTTDNVIALTPDQVKDRVSTGQWTKSEGREWDRINLGVELPDDAKIEQEEEENKKMMKQKAFDKSKEIKKEHLKNKRVCGVCREGQHGLCKKRGCQCQ